MPKIPSQLSYLIGSLPFTNPRDALALLREFPPSIYSLPQLPRRSFKEAMIPQSSEGFPGISVDEAGKKIVVNKGDGLLTEMASFYESIVAGSSKPFAISQEYAMGYDLALQNLKGEKSLQFIKTQVTGPFTFGLGLNDNEGKAVWFDEQYRDIVLKGIPAKANWFVEQLSQFAEQVVISLDEPILSALGTPAYLGIKDEDVINGLNEVIDAVRAQGAWVAVHCCGNMDWGLLARTNLDIMSFDAYFYGEKVALYPDEIQQFLTRGGVLAWGIVPTSDQEIIAKINIESLTERVAELLKLFSN